MVLPGLIRFWCSLVTWHFDLGMQPYRSVPCSTRHRILPGQNQTKWRWATGSHRYHACKWSVHLHRRPLPLHGPMRFCIISAVLSPPPNLPAGRTSSFIRQYSTCRWCLLYQLISCTADCRSLRTHSNFAFLLWASKCLFSLSSSLLPWQPSCTWSK